MDDIGTILDELDQTQTAYVWERVEHLNAKIETILKKVGISKSAFYDRYDADERERLEEIARTLVNNTNYRALRLNREKSVDAMQTLVNLMNNSKSDYVKLQAAQSLLAYALGTPIQRKDITSNGQTLQLYGNVSPDDWDE